MKNSGYLYVFATVFFAVFGQIVGKLRLNAMNWSLNTYSGWPGIIKSILSMVFDPYIFFAYLTAFLSSVCWMVALSKFELTKIYPFMSISPVLVFIIGIFFMGEAFTWGKLLGFFLIIVGILVTIKL